MGVAFSVSEILLFNNYYVILSLLPNSPWKREGFSSPHQSSPTAGIMCGILMMSSCALLIILERRWVTSYHCYASLVRKKKREWKRRKAMRYWIKTFMITGLSVLLMITVTLILPCTMTLPLKLQLLNFNFLIAWDNSPGQWELWSMEYSWSS